MATTAIVKANSLFSSKQSQNRHVKLCCVKTLNYTWSLKSAGIKVRRGIMANCTTSSSTRNNDMAAMITDWKKLEKYPLENFAFVAVAVITTTLIKWLKITAVVTASFLLLGMIMYGRESAFALYGGAMGGDSISLSSPSSDHSSWSDE